MRGRDIEFECGVVPVTWGSTSTSEEWVKSVYSALALMLGLMFQTIWQTLEQYLLPQLAHLSYMPFLILPSLILCDFKCR
ncbi:hypothetical protein B0J14DRAFT_598862 [Halenospora varia]|nr:hypothetical protein B0J14DRAFT_598862 [Halenospora varia]